MPIDEIRIDDPHQLNFREFGESVFILDLGLQVNIDADDDNRTIRVTSGANLYTIVYHDNHAGITIRSNGPPQVFFHAYLSLGARQHFYDIFGVPLPGENGIALGVGLGLAAPMIPLANPLVLPPPFLIPAIVPVPFCIGLLNDAEAADPIGQQYDDEPFDTIAQDTLPYNSIAYMLNDNPNSVYRGDELRNWFNGILGPRCRDPLTNLDVFAVTKIEIVQ